MESEGRMLPAWKRCEWCQGKDLAPPCSRTAKGWIEGSVGKRPGAAAGVAAETRFVKGLSFPAGELMFYSSIIPMLYLR